MGSVGSGQPLKAPQKSGASVLALWKARRQWRETVSPAMDEPMDYEDEDVQGVPIADEAHQVLACPIVSSLLPSPVSQPPQLTHRLNPAS